MGLGVGFKDGVGSWDEGSWKSLGGGWDWTDDSLMIQSQCPSVFFEFTRVQFGPNQTDQSYLILRSTSFVSATRSFRVLITLHPV